MLLSGTARQLTGPKQSPAAPSPRFPPCTYRRLLTQRSRHKTSGSSDKAGAAEPRAALCQPCLHRALSLAATPHPQHP